MIRRFEELKKMSEPQAKSHWVYYTIPIHLYQADRMSRFQRDLRLLDSLVAAAPDECSGAAFFLNGRGFGQDNVV